MENSNMSALVSLLGRVLLSLIFIVAGVEKILGYEGTTAYMQSAGVPGILLPAVILLELGGGLAVLFGLLSRFSAIALAIFCLVSGVIFHNPMGGDQMQAIMFMKNVAIAGGLLMLAANGPGRFSIRA